MFVCSRALYLANLYLCQCILVALLIALVLLLLLGHVSKRGSGADAPFQGLRVLCLSFALALLSCLCFAHQVSLGVPSAEVGQRVFLKVNYKLAG